MGPGKTRKRFGVDRHPGARRRDPACGAEQPLALSFPRGKLGPSAGAKLGIGGREPLSVAVTKARHAAFARSGNPGHAPLEMTRPGWPGAMHLDAHAARRRGAVSG